jgi:ATP-dependent RNA helicase DHX33
MIVLGQDDIENLDLLIRNHARQLPKDSPEVITRVFYASLSNESQTAVFKPVGNGQRKCILATNIAETSITIPGVRYVIDTGKHKEKRHISQVGGSSMLTLNNLRSLFNIVFDLGIEILQTVNIPKSSAVQRAGRAGREGAGFCFRLYTEEAFNNMPLSQEPEISRTNLTGALLQLKCAGQDMEDMEFMDPLDQTAGM